MLHQHAGEINTQMPSYVVQHVQSALNHGEMRISSLELILRRHEAAQWLQNSSARHRIQSGFRYLLLLLLLLLLMLLLLLLLLLLVLLLSLLMLLRLPRGYARVACLRDLETAG
eukprot:414962-Hanusia_phi.AAC.1